MDITFGELKEGQMFTWEGVPMMRTNSIIVTNLGGGQPKFLRCVNLETGRILDQPDDTPVKIVP